MSVSYIKLVTITIFSTVLLSCSSKQEAEASKEVETQEENTEASFSNEDELILRINTLVLNNLTIPISVIEDLKKEEGEDVYHQEYINSLENISNYDSKFSQALNFGVYGMDIIYNVAHDHILDVKEYKEKTLPLAQELGLASFYTESDMEKFISFASSHKSLNEFIIDEYHKIDEYLISHHNYETAVLSITGGALEGMYFTGKSIEENGLSDLKYSLLINEKHLINQIVPMYDFFPDNTKMAALKAELVKIQEDLNSFSTREELNDEVAKKLDDDILALREKIVSNAI